MLLSQRHLARLLLAVPLTAALASPLPAQVAAPALVGKVCPGGAADCNNCVGDVQLEFNLLRDHGEVMGFHMGSAPDDVAFCLGCPHWQGIQRLPVAGGRHLVVTKSSGQMFSVVRMGSRNTAGKRFRSNRLNRSLFYYQTAPPVADAIVAQFPNDVGFTHSGGIQAVGNYVAVPLENDAESKIAIFDFSNPEVPVRRTNIVHRESNEAGTASLAKLADGRFVLVFGRKDAEELDFYVSDTTDLNTTNFQPFDTWTKPEIGASFREYQSLNFVTQCDGALFLIGTHESSGLSTGGEDFADLYQVTNAGGNQVALSPRGSKHLYCGYPSPGGSASQNTHCNFDAAGGVYVPPSGHLMLYGTEHANNGPGNTVRFMEFRSINPNHGCGEDPNEAWVELYDDSNFSDRGLMIDFPDEQLENYADYDWAEGFEDKASAVRWCIPPGRRYRLFRDKSFTGSFHDLVGGGERNLHNVGFGDKTSSSRIMNF